MDDFFFVFSNDGSSDNSIDVIKKHFGGLQYAIVGDATNHGPGYAFNNGFEWILNHSENKDDLVITMEADCTSDITLLPKMIAISRLGFDMVLASVYAQGGGFSKTNFFRKLISSIASLLFRFLFNIKVLTLSSFYRAYTVNILRKIKSQNKQIISEKGFICMLEILIKAIYEHATIIEIPMILNSKRRIGKSKMKVIKTTWLYFRFIIKQKIHPHRKPYTF